MKIKLTLVHEYVIDTETDIDKDHFKDMLANTGAAINNPSNEEVHDAIRSMLEEEIDSILDLDQIDENDFTIEVLNDK